MFRIPELRNKVFFTLALLCVYRIGFYVPLPGVNSAEILKSVGAGQGGALETISNYLTLFAGGNLSQSTIFGLGIMPYISASIILQLLATVIPTLEKLRKEGEPGVRKINEWTRYLTVGVCIVQAAMWLGHLANNSNLLYPMIAENPMARRLFIIQGLIVLTAGSLFLMWLGEQIDHYGIGNGVSLIITAGIVSRMPSAALDVWKQSSFANFWVNWQHSGFAQALKGVFDVGANAKYSVFHILFLVIAFIIVVAGSILLTQAQRRIKIQQAKQMRGRRVYGGTQQYLPLRVNHAGVMPIIFASSLMTIAAMPVTSGYNAVFAIGGHDMGVNSWKPVVGAVILGFHPGQYLYETLYVALIFFFAYFWNTVQFQPKEMANQLRDYGSFIPGLRPGKRTADYLENVMTRITYVGAAFLAIIAVIPTLIATNLLKGDPNGFMVAQFLGGTGLLIVIQVMLDLVNRIEANLVMRNYGGFLEGGTPAKVRDRGSRPNRGNPSPSNPPRGLPT